jgi:hypothetical protein
VSAAARLRGLGTAAVTATLAASAHAAAGGGLPSGAAVAELVVLAAALGAIAFTVRAGTGALLALLAAGQLLGHLLLGVGGHDHSAHAGPPAIAMLTAHLAAVIIGAFLIAAGEHLCAAVSRAVRTAETGPAQLPCAATAIVRRGADQPMRSSLLLAASMSHRGPPVSLAP